MNRRNRTILISGVMMLLATIMISLFCMKDWSGLTGWAFAAMLWSEIVFFGGLIFTEWISERTEQVITRSMLYTVIFAYSVINFLVSVCYMTLLKEAGTSFTVIQIVLLVIAAIAIFISLTVSGGVQKGNEHTLKSTAKVDAMVERLNKLAVCPECEPFSSSLKKLSDDLRFTDTSKVVSEDAEISDVISNIEIAADSVEESFNEKMQAALVRLNTLISKRKISVNAVNKGKI